MISSMIVYMDSHKNYFRRLFTDWYRIILRISTRIHAGTYSWISHGVLSKLPPRILLAITTEVLPMLLSRLSPSIHRKISLGNLQKIPAR